MIRILTDSASDILPAEAEQLGVTVIPLNVTLEDGSILRDGIDMTPTEYYAHLASCRKLPTTSQPSPELFEKFYLEAAAAGDEVLGIFLSHELSGTWQCAKLAADLANVDNVLFVDSATVCLGESLLVRLAVQLRDAGKTLVQIATDLEHAKEHLHLVAAIDDLKYLRKGGRLPAAVAVAGGMLGIKPLITIKDGKVAWPVRAAACPVPMWPCSRRSKSWAASARTLPLLPVILPACGKCSPSRTTSVKICTWANRWCARSAASSAPTQAPVHLVWHSLTKGWCWNKRPPKNDHPSKVGQPAGCPTCFLRRETGANSLSQNLTVLPAPSEREPLARPALTALRPR